MLLIRKLVDKIHQHLLGVRELIPVIWMLEIWTLVRVLTISTIVTTLILQDVWKDVLLPLIDKLLTELNMG